MSDHTSIWGAVITVMGGGFFTILGIYLNKKAPHPDEDLVRELRKEIKDLKEK